MRTVTCTEAPGASEPDGSAVTYCPAGAIPVAFAKTSPAVRLLNTNWSGAVSADALVLVMVTVPVYCLVSRLKERPVDVMLTLPVTSVLEGADAGGRLKYPTSQSWSEIRSGRVNVPR